MTVAYSSTTRITLWVWWLTPVGLAFSPTWRYE